MWYKTRISHSDSDSRLIDILALIPFIIRNLFIYVYIYSSIINYNSKSYIYSNIQKLGEFTYIYIVHGKEYVNCCVVVVECTSIWFGLEK